MEDTLKMMYERALQQNDVYPKALANFVFKQVIETAHVKYNISQEDIRMNKSVLLKNDHLSQFCYRLSVFC